MFQAFQSTFLNLIKQADKYGAVFRPSFKAQTQHHKTIKGGIISIVIYGLSLSYFTFGIHQWATNQVLPNVVDQKIMDEIVSYQTSQKIISIQYDFDNGIIDPFDEQNIILMVVQQYYNDAYAISNFTRINKKINGKFYIQNLSLLIDNSDKKEKITQESFVFIVPCDKSLLEQGEQCASESLIQKFWDQPNMLKIKFYLQQYNTNSRSLKQLYRLFYISLNEDQTFVNGLQLQLTKTITDTGILFPHFQQYEFISDIFQQSQSITFQAGTKLFEFPVYCSLFITIDPLQKQQSIAFPNISNVLAGIGSIVSILLSFKYVAKFINQRSLQEEAIFDVIKMFYPEFNEIRIKKTWLVKVKQVKNKQTNLYYNVEDYKQYYNRLAYAAEQKLCISNTIYELSRLQFAIQQFMPRDELIKLRERFLKYRQKPINLEITRQLFRNNNPLIDIKQQIQFKTQRKRNQNKVKSKLQLMIQSTNRTVIIKLHLLRTILIYYARADILKNDQQPNQTLEKIFQ